MPTTTMGCKDANLSEKSMYHDFGDNMVVAVLQKEWVKNTYKTQGFHKTFILQNHNFYIYIAGKNLDTNVGARKHERICFRHIHSTFKHSQYSLLQIRQNHFIVIWKWLRVPPHGPQVVEKILKEIPRIIKMLTTSCLRSSSLEWHGFTIRWTDVEIQPYYQLSGCWLNLYIRNYTFAMIWVITWFWEKCSGRRSHCRWVWQNPLSAMITTMLKIRSPRYEFIR